MRQDLLGVSLYLGEDLGRRAGWTQDELRASRLDESSQFLQAFLGRTHETSLVQSLWSHRQIAEKRCDRAPSGLAILGDVRQ